MGQLEDKQAVPLSMFSFKWQFFLVSAPILLSFSSIRMHISAKSCTCCSSRWSVFTSGIVMVAHTVLKTDNEESFTKSNIHKVLGRVWEITKWLVFLTWCKNCTPVVFWEGLHAFRFLKIPIHNTNHIATFHRCLKHLYFSGSPCSSCCRTAILSLTSLWAASGSWLSAE